MAKTDKKDMLLKKVVDFFASIDPNPTAESLREKGFNLDRTTSSQPRFDLRRIIRGLDNAGLLRNETGRIHPTLALSSLGAPEPLIERFASTGELQKALGLRRPSLPAPPQAGGLDVTETQGVDQLRKIAPPVDVTSVPVPRNLENETIQLIQNSLNNINNSLRLLSRL